MARSKLLTQEEIDALLKSGLRAKEEKKEEKTRHVRIYDFRHPDRVSRDQLRALRNINDRFARTLATYLSNALRTIVDVRISTIDQVTYSEFLMSLEDPTCLYTLVLKNIKGKALFQIDINLFFLILDRLLGGPGTVIESQRSMTIIEQQVMENIIKTLLGMWNEAFSQVEPLDPEIESFETNPQFVRVASHSETVIVFVFEVSFLEHAAGFNICVPYFTFENVIHKVTAQTFMELKKEKVSEEDRLIIREHLNDVYIPISIKLGETTITIGEFLNLQVGDILVTNRKIYEPLDGLFKGVMKIKGIPGVVGRNKAIKVVETIKEKAVNLKATGGGK